MLLFEFVVDLFGSIETLIRAAGRIQFELSFKDYEEKLIMGDLLYVSNWTGIV